MTYKRFNTKPFKYAPQNAFKTESKDRAKQIQQMIKEGMTQEEIADSLGIKRTTVKNYIKKYL